MIRCPRNRGKLSEALREAMARGRGEDDRTSTSTLREERAGVVPRLPE